MFDVLHRLTLNTPNNILVLNFEPVDYDYTLETDKMAALVLYSNYSESPVRDQPYAYVRAQRMKSAGAANTKIVAHNGREQPEDYYGNQRQPGQTPHSAKGLSRTSMERAKRIQSARARLECAGTATSVSRSQAVPETRKRAVQSAASLRAARAPSMKSVSLSGKPPIAAAAVAVASSHAGKSRTGMSGSQSMASARGIRIDVPEEPDSSDSEGEDYERQRRVSWAFQHPFPPRTRELDLSEMKSLLRSQIRAKGDAVPPDFIYMTINNIQATMQRSEASRNMEMNRREEELIRNKKLGRPSSSPCRLDPRTKVPIEDSGWDQFLREQGLADNADTKLDGESRISSATNKSCKARAGTVGQGSAPPVTTTVVTQFASVPIDARPHLSIHSNKTKSSIPKATLLRRHTATVRTSTKEQQGAIRACPASARVDGAPTTTPHTVISYMQPSRQQGHRHSSSAIETNHVPMKILPADLEIRLERMRHRTAERLQQANQVQRDDEGKPIGRVTEVNDPMRNHVNFRLLTHEQVGQQMSDMLQTYTKDAQRKRKKQERQHHAVWLAKVKGLTDRDFSRKPRPVAPELREYSEMQSVS